VREKILTRESSQKKFFHGRKIVLLYENRILSRLKLRPNLKLLTAAAAAAVAVYSVHL